MVGAGLSGGELRLNLKRVLVVVKPICKRSQLSHFEIHFARTAIRAGPVAGDIIPHRSSRYTVIRQAD